MDCTYNWISPLNNNSPPKNAVRKELISVQLSIPTKELLYSIIKFNDGLANHYPYEYWNTQKRTGSHHFIAIECN